MACEICETIETTGWIGDSTSSHCRGCHRSWSGTSAGHCKACHEHFRSETAFRRHRRDNACVPPADVGLIESDRGWMGNAPSPFIRPTPEQTWIP